MMLSLFGRIQHPSEAAPTPASLSPFNATCSTSSHRLLDIDRFAEQSSRSSCLNSGLHGLMRGNHGHGRQSASPVFPARIRAPFPSGRRMSVRRTSIHTFRAGVGLRPGLQRMGVRPMRSKRHQRTRLRYQARQVDDERTLVHLRPIDWLLPKFMRSARPGVLLKRRCWHCSSHRVYSSVMYKPRRSRCDGWKERLRWLLSIHVADALAVVRVFQARLYGCSFGSHSRDSDVDD
jgi:hypothetical protein